MIYLKSFTFCLLRIVMTFNNFGCEVKKEVRRKANIGDAPLSIFLPVQELSY